jgi:prophage tail gpP-like protein
LRIGRNVFPYWTDVAVAKRLDTIANSFSLSLVSSSSPDLFSFPIDIGDRAALSLSSQYLISGYIDALETNFSLEGHRISISGRDNTGDLVDCSVVLEGDEFLNQSLTQIAQALCRPFDIPVKPGGDPTPIPSFKIDPGETVFDALERAARLKGVLFRPDGLGNLKIVKIAEKTSTTSLIEGQNIKSANVSYDHTDRFSDYIVRGQNMLATETDEGGENIEGTASDKVIRRYRPKLTLAHTSVNREQASALAAWENTVSAARSILVSIETPGWTKTDGALWDVNELIKVKSPSLGIDAYMLASGVDFSFDKKKGMLTTIELTRVGAFIPKTMIQGDL